MTDPEPESTDDRRRGSELATAPWRRRSRREVYRNPWITVVEDDVELPNGATTVYGVVRCSGAVGMLPFVDDDHVVMVQQYRYVAGRSTWEMPTGGVDDGEELALAAQRELSEEIGFRATHLDYLTSFDSSKSVVEEVCHLYVARGLVAAPEATPDDTELIRREVLPFADVVAMVLDGTITDAMTVVAVLFEERRRRVS